MGVLEDAERAWTGELRVDDAHPLAGTGELVEVTGGVAFLHAFANVTAVSTEGGLLMIDTGNPASAGWVHGTIRGWTPDRLHTAIFSHGHIDHVFGVGPFEEEARANRQTPPTVVAHQNVPLRFDRYRFTAGYNAVINRRQFSASGLEWPTEYRYPDDTYREALDVSVGDELVHLRHARGETDDATWTWLPQRRVLCPGDLFIWCTPNAGNPQKVQRYPDEWAAALRRMASFGADVLLPGHGWPILGAERIRIALSHTAELLESIVVQTISVMNSGGRLDDAIHTVEVPDRLAGLPYLQPVYDEPEFIVRNVWRLYGGWYDGNPATLKPAREAELAVELAGLAGGAGRLAARARELAATGEHRLAGHLAETARLAAPEDRDVLAAHAEVFGTRADAERSTMAKGVYRWAAEESSGEEPTA
jgi:alkyl sulfatase BDS1-like metallo-beta-lactamase superfamily hydrolase